MEDAIDLLPHTIQTMTKMAESAGIRNPEDFYPEYTEEKVKKLQQLAQERAQQRDPALALEQAKGQTAIEVAKANGQTQLQVEAGKTEVQREVENIKAQGNIVKETAQMEADERIKTIELNNALMLQQQQIESDERIKAATLEFEKYKLEATVQLDREKMANAAQIAAMKPKPEPGGKPAGK
jgi:hypothetical protein